MSMCAVRVVLSANFSVTVHTPFLLNVNADAASLPVLFLVVAASSEPSGGVNVIVAHLFELYADKMKWCG